jgi:uncharacterized protein (DUF2344 family)
LSPSGKQTDEPWYPELPSVPPDYEQHFPISDTARYVLRLAHDEYMRLTEWAVVQLRRIDGDWCTVAVYDTCHGKGVHMHLYNRQGERSTEVSLREVQSYADLEAGLDDAVERVSRDWLENERRSDRE